MSFFKIIVPVFLIISCIVSFSSQAEEQFSYRLGSGDKLEIKIFNQPDLNGEYTIDGEGKISMPLIGVVQVGGKTVKELEENLARKYAPDFFVDPRFSIQVLNYRPFFILGEVNNPNSYPYVNGMTYLTAVAIAGGFTYRAKQEYVFVVRDNDPEKKEVQVNIEDYVRPGDIIRVDERLF